jgi:hypothetical protein
MTQTDIGVVRKEIVVHAPIDRALDVFTTRFGDVEPPEHNPLHAALAETVFALTDGVDGDEGWPLYLTSYAAHFTMAS